MRVKKNLRTRCDRRIRNLSSGLSSLLVLAVLRPLLHLLRYRRPIFAHAVHDPLHRVDGRLRASLLGRQNLALLVNHEDAALGLLLHGHADGGDEEVLWVAEEGVGEVLLGFEGGVRLGAVGA